MRSISAPYTASSSSSSSMVTRISSPFSSTALRMLTSKSSSPLSSAGTRARYLLPSYSSSARTSSSYSLPSSSVMEIKSLPYSSFIVASSAGFVLAPILTSCAYKIKRKFCRCAIQEQKSSSARVKAARPATYTPCDKSARSSARGREKMLRPVSTSAAPGSSR